MNEILVTRSAKHGERHWRFVGEREHVTSDGRSITLKVWRGSCVKCGAAYDVASTGGPGTRAFGVVHCKTHRGKAPRRASAPRGLGCRLLAAHFDFAEHQARLMLPAGHCTDMQGAIEFCRGVDPRRCRHSHGLGRSARHALPQRRRRLAGVRAAPRGLGGRRHAVTFSPAKPTHASFAALGAAIQPKPKLARCPSTRRKPKPTCSGGKPRA